jgi:hypothetical protein
LLDLQDGTLDGGLKTAWLQARPMDLFVPFVCCCCSVLLARLVLRGCRKYAATGWPDAGLRHRLRLAAARFAPRPHSLALGRSIPAVAAWPHGVVPDPRRPARGAGTSCNGGCAVPGPTFRAGARRSSAARGYRTHAVTPADFLLGPAREPLEVFGWSAGDAPTRSFRPRHPRRRHLGANCGADRPSSHLVDYLVEDVDAAALAGLRQMLQGVPCGGRWDFVRRTCGSMVGCWSTRCRRQPDGVT